MNCRSIFPDNGTNKELCKVIKPSILFPGNMDSKECPHKVATNSSTRALPLGQDDDPWISPFERILGVYDEDIEEYQTPPMGFFLVLTKMGLTTGLNVSCGINANYSLVSNVEKKILGFCSADFMLGPEFMLLMEVKEIVAWDSYLNAGAKYLLTPELDFEFSVLDIGGRIETERIIKVTYKKMWGEF